MTPGAPRSLPRPQAVEHGVRRRVEIALRHRGEHAAKQRQTVNAHLVGHADQHIAARFIALTQCLLHQRALLHLLHLALNDALLPHVANAARHAEDIVAERRAFRPDANTARNGGKPLRVEVRRFAVSLFEIQNGNDLAHNGSSLTGATA